MSLKSKTQRDRAAAFEAAVRDLAVAAEAQRLMALAALSRGAL
ncbi:hypothetical protein [Brevundimonas sp. Root1279]|nr:hypothetical protein [Brevundimonas sp. Root1279]